VETGSSPYNNVMTLETDSSSYNSHHSGNRFITLQQSSQWKQTHHLKTKMSSQWKQTHHLKTTMSSQWKQTHLTMSSPWKQTHHLTAVITVETDSSPYNSHHSGNRLITSRQKCHHSGNRLITLRQRHHSGNRLITLQQCNHRGKTHHLKTVITVETDSSPYSSHQSGNRLITLQQCYHIGNRLITLRQQCYHSGNWVSYDGRLQSSWTHLIILSRNFVEVRWRSLFPRQGMHFLQRSTNFSKTCCRPLITSKFLAS
jgi:hypothetical protein